MTALLPLIPILPLGGFVLTGLLGRRYPGSAHLIAVWAVVASWVVASLVAFMTLARISPFGGEGAGFTLWTWIPANGFAGGFNAAMGLFADPLTACLLIVVTTIGMLVHVYSIGYMAHDPGRWRFFAYLNLFMFSMLLLVLADNFLLVFAGWELVGLCSYLLIGFWYPRRSAAVAAKKAFLVNRVGDMGFALAIMAIWTQLGTLNMQDVFHKFGSVPHEWQIAIALLIFCGAVGKSAQFPLHVWLPDAMEGPTPVSALIHAATMVNAGVYLVARCNPIFGATSEVMVVVAAIGIFTAILAASIAFTQTDIKRVLAYSTLSQLGYMFASLGVGAWTAAIFHLMSHGFFKGLLFLDSGSVIHAIGDEQDMRRMGGLWRKIPITYATMLVGSIAIAGVPPLAGFFSKDEILGGAFKAGFLWVWAIGFAVAGMTAFYMFRLMGMTFWGPSHVDPEVEHHIHESPRSMTGPLILFAIPSALLGLAIGFPPETGLLHQWLAPVFEGTIAASGHTEATYSFFGIDGALAIGTTALVAIAIVLAWRLFGVEIPALGLRAQPRPDRVRELSARRGLAALYNGSFNKWWFDDINHKLFVDWGGRLAAAVFWFDRTVVDGTVNGIGTVTAAAGMRLRRVQTGRVQNYALGIALGLIVMAAGYLYVLLVAR
ncbi:MAG: NADH-quinone oxidoreductase subunit L [Candidatus Limnocylindrales bacterium]|jgi:NADH-quinone oxidoreductase subunit L